MTECGWCGGPLPDDAWDALPPHNPRKWCTNGCKQRAYLARLTPIALAAVLARKAAARIKARDNKRRF